MKEKRNSKPFYCHKCGNQLIKEEKYKANKKEDTPLEDVNQYYYSRDNENVNKKQEYNVVNPQFRCKYCERTIEVEHQKTINIIQKKLKSNRLSEIEIKEHYEKASKTRKHQRLFNVFLYPFLFLIVIFVIDYILMSTTNIDETAIIVSSISIMFAIIIGLAKGMAGIHFYNENDTDFTYDETEHLSTLHTYTLKNKSLIEKSKICYCYHCKNKILVEDIVDYLDEGETAVCPKCNVDSLIPDCIDEEITDKVIDDMNRYWF